MKKYLTLLVVLLLSIILASVANAKQTDITVTVDDELVELHQSPIFSGDFMYVPTRPLVEKLGAEVSWDNDDRTLTAIKEHTRVTLKVGEKIGFKNGIPFNMGLEAKIVDNNLLVPLSFFSQGLDARVKWDNNSKTLAVTSKEQQASAAAVSSKREILSFENTLQKALATNYSLKNAYAEIERTYEIRNKAHDNVEDLPVPGLTQNANINTAVKAATQTDIAWHMARKKVELLEDAIYYSLKQAYNGVLQGEKNIRFIDLSLENLLWKEQILKKLYEQGNASQFELTQLDFNLAEFAERKRLAESKLQKAYEDLNHLIGLGKDQRPLLEEEINFEKIDLLDIETHIRKVTNESTAVWLAEQKVNIANLNLRLYVFNDKVNLSTYKATAIEVEQTENELSDTKKELEKVTRSTYNNLKQIEHQYEAAKMLLAKAEENYNLIKIRYDVGMAIEADLFAAKLAVEENQLELYNLAAKYDNLKVLLIKPWVASAGM